MSEEPGVSSSEMRSTTSWGDAVEGRLGLVGQRHRRDGLHNLNAALTRFGGGGRRFLRHRHDGPAKRLTLVLESQYGKHMRSQRLLRILDPDRDIEQWREALTHEELAQFAAHEHRDLDDLSSGCSAHRRNLEIGDLLRVGI